MILQVYIDADTERRMRAASTELGSTLEYLAEAAVAEAACQYARDLPHDPAKDRRETETA